MAGAIAICDGSATGCGVHGSTTGPTCESAIDRLESRVGYTCPFCEGDVLFVGDDTANAADIEQLLADDLSVW